MTKSVIATNIRRQANSDTDSPLDLGEELGFKDASGLEPLREFASEQKSLCSELQQYVPHYLPKVHPTDHLLIPDRETERDLNTQAYCYTVLLTESHCGKTHFRFYG